MPGNDSHNEQELLIRISQGDQESFARLVDVYWKKVFGFALAYGKSSQLAEETTQDVFMDIWKSRDRLTLIDNFPNYLFIITRNRVFKLFRTKLRATVDLDEENTFENIWLPHQQLEVRELDGLILKGIERLPPMRKKVFILSRFEGLSYKQIGTELNLSPNTVKEHIVKALNTLRQYLEERNKPNIDTVLICLLTAISSSQ